MKTADPLYQMGIQCSPQVELGRLCQESETINPEENPDHIFKYVDISSVSNTDFSILDTKDILGKSAPSRARKRIHTDDVIFATVRPSLRRVAIIPPELDSQVCSTGFCVLRPNKEFLFPLYLYYYLITDKVKQYVGLIEKGATYPAINDSDLLNLCIPLPPLREQRAIARVLRAVQEVMQALRRELELERERKAALMHHLFRYGTRGEPTRQTEIGEIPQSWEVVRLGDIVTLQRGVDLPIQRRSPGTIPVVGSNGIVGWHNQALSDEPVPGITIGRSGSVGSLCYLEQPYWPLNTVLYVSDFHGNDPQFIYYWLHLFGFEKYSQGVSVPTLNRNSVYPILFPLPPLEEQLQIAQIMAVSDLKIAAIERELALYQELFHTLLEELMSGRLSVQPLLEQEPA